MSKFGRYGKDPLASTLDSYINSSHRNRSATTHQFAEASTLSFAIHKEQLVEQFRIENVWDLVEMPAHLPGVPVMPPGLMESTVDSIAPPITFVADKMQIYDARSAQLIIDQEQIILDNIPGVENNTAAGQAVRTARRPHRLSAETSRLDRISKRDQIRDNYEKEYHILAENHKNRVEKFKEKQSKCRSVFSKMLSDSVRSRVRDLLQESRFREAWRRLEIHYAPGAGERGTIHSVNSFYERYVWTRGTIVDHLDILNKLETQLNDAGRHIDDDTRIYNLLRSIEESKFEKFKDIIGLAKWNHTPLEEIKERLQSRMLDIDTQVDLSKHSRHLNTVKEVSVNEASKGPRRASENHKKKKTDRSSARAASTELTCEHCQRKGHSAKDCYKKKPCLFCGETHNPLWCNENPDRGDRIKLREKRTATVAEVTEVIPVGTEVNLAKRFKSLNPQPKKGK
jgi:hypothetical protein